MPWLTSIGIKRLNVPAHLFNPMASNQLSWSQVNVFRLVQVVMNHTSFLNLRMRAKNIQRILRIHSWIISAKWQKLLSIMMLNVNMKLHLLCNQLSSFWICSMLEFKTKNALMMHNTLRKVPYKKRWCNVMELMPFFMTIINFLNHVIALVTKSHRDQREVSFIRKVFAHSVHSMVFIALLNWRQKLVKHQWPIHCLKLI